MNLEIEDVAEIAYTSVASYAGLSLPTWTCVNVEARREYIDIVSALWHQPATIADAHLIWYRMRENSGWRYGEFWNPREKTDPGMLDLHNVSRKHITKLSIIVGIVAMAQRHRRMS